MRESRWNPQLPVVLCRQFDPNPLSECGALSAKIDCNIKDCTAGRPYQLPLWLPNLIVQAAEYSPMTPTVIVLYEIDIRSHGCREGVSIKAFEKETSCVPKYRRFNDQNVRDIRAHNL